jgi:alkanesulfonate monooxygenase SsuD/methylene tetrahydromethanopterin reductase-like flavin-dependent oxidoreductase (luciferase family)
MQLTGLRVFTEPQQGASYGDLLAVAQRAEACGFGAFFRSDHYLAMGGGDGLSDGRVELGLGAGWYQQEHEAYGIEFPALGERFDRLEEQLEIITGMWSTPVGETFESPGGHYPVTDSPALPKPRQSPVPIDFFTTQCDRVRTACAAIDRDPATMTFSAALVACVGADEAEVERRATAIGREPEELRQNGVAGTPEEAAATIRRWADAGADRIYLQILDLADLDHLDLIATEVAPLLA